LPFLGSVTTSKDTRCPSLRLVHPARSTALMWTKTSPDPSSDVMKPKPFWSLKNFTVPTVMAIPLCGIGKVAPLCHRCQQNYVTVPTSFSRLVRRLLKADGEAVAETSESSIRIYHFSKLKGICAKPPSIPFRVSCVGSVALLGISARRNAGTFFAMRAMFVPDRNRHYFEL